MSLRKLPEVKAFQRPESFQWDEPTDLVAKWSETPMAAAEGEDTIAIFDVIGEDWFGGGFTAKRAAAALRSIGNKPVTVQINSPGGDVFEGIAIYNLLRAHPEKVTVEVMGWAASAASIIAMAGDDIRMGLGSFIMIHNAWGGAVGNKHDFAAVVDVLTSIDQALVDIYEARVSIDRKAIEKLMDAETFLGTTEAMAKGFADAIDTELAAKAAAATTTATADRPLVARRQVEAAMAKSGISRTLRSEILSELLSSPAARDAGRDAARDAGVDAALRQLYSTINQN